MSTAVRLLGVDDANLYKATHKNHPCCVWVRSSRGHFDYLIKLTDALYKQYTKRYGKIHKCELDDKLGTFRKYSKMFVDNGWQDPPECMPDECKLGDVVSSYRNYYLMKKVDILSWKNGQPEWVK